ncbi:MAG: DUF5677 domain-containing protein [Advenella sp.]
MDKHDILFDRAGARSLAESRLCDEIKVLSDVVEFGSNLILRFNNHTDRSEFVFHEFIVGGSLLKQLVGMLDASVELLKIGHSFPALLPVRSAFEAYLYILLILQKDKDRRSRLYYIAEMHRRRQLNMDVLEGNSIPEGLRQDLQEVGGKPPPPISDSAKSLLIDDIKSIDRLLEMPVHKSHNEIYLAKRGKRRELDWFKALGLESLWAVAKTVRKDGEYKLIYNPGSRAMHAQSYADQFETVNGISYLKPIRHLNHAYEIVDSIILMGRYVYSAIIKEYLPTEYDVFMAKFRADWRPYMLTGKRINYEYSPFTETGHGVRS